MLEESSLQMSANIVPSLNINFSPTFLYALFQGLINSCFVFSIPFNAASELFPTGKPRNHNHLRMRQRVPGRDIQLIIHYYFLKLSGFPAVR